MSDVGLDDFEDLGADFGEDEFEEEPDAGLARVLEPPPVTAEQRAKAMGWKPLPADPRNPQPNEYRGDPRRWTDAATFIAHGEEELPILRDQNRRMSEKLARLDPAEIETMRNTIAQQAVALKRAESIALRADKAGYDRALAELKTKQREAVETGDTVGFDQVQEQIDAAIAARAEVEKVPDPEPAPPPAPATEGRWPETTAFLAENPWFQTDAVLQSAMIKAHEAMVTLHPNIGRVEGYARAKAQVVEAYPDRFPSDQLEDEPVAREPEPAPARQPSRQPARAAVLAPSAPVAPGERRKSPFDLIPEEERADARAGFEYARKGDSELPASEYVALYLNPKLNPIELRERRKKA